MFQGVLVSLPRNPPVPLPLLSSTPGTSCPVETQHPESQTPPLCLAASLSRGCKDNNSAFFEVSGQDFCNMGMGKGQGRAQTCVQTLILG